MKIRNVWLADLLGSASFFLSVRFKKRIGGNTYDRTIALPWHDGGFAAQIRVVPLFDRRLKAIHVDANDFTTAHATQCYSWFQSVRQQRNLGLVESSYDSFTGGRES